ncbi:MAG TPA: hypothetical protein VK645_13435 [Chitinophagaceae bacterium]|nr:hypothetical protein [Chitinophagaceae bacterium]
MKNLKITKEKKIVLSEQDMLTKGDNERKREDKAGWLLIIEMIVGFAQLILG